MGDTTFPTTVDSFTPPAESTHLNIDKLQKGMVAVQTMLKAVRQAHFDIGGFQAADGTALAKFADNAASNPGFHLADSKSRCIRWNNAASQASVLSGIPLPQDLDDTADVVVHLEASKSGATAGDATKFTIAAYFQTVGAAHDADANCGGDTNALTATATAKTVAELTLTIAAADVPAAPCNLTILVQPKDGTLGTDDAMMHAIWLEYTPKTAS